MPIQVSLFIGLVLAFFIVFALTRKNRRTDNQREFGSERRDDTSSNVRQLRREAVHPLPATQSKPKGQPKSQENKVVRGRARVIDGDTIEIKKLRLRLFGIDAPEIDHPFGQKAKWAMVRLCNGQEISAEILENDKYDRTVAKCFLPDGRDLSAELVKQGLALDWKKFSGGVYEKYEPANIRKKLFRTAARQKGHIKLWAGEYSKKQEDVSG